MTDEDDREGELPAQAMMRAIQREMRGKGKGAGWSYSASYAANHNGAVSGAAVAADKNRASEQHRAAQREFARRTGMTEYEYNQLQKYKAINEANRKNFVAQARAGKFQGNIYLSGQIWKDLAASVDENGNLSETVDLSEKGKNGEAMKLLNAWAKAINDPNVARYGGRYNMNALPKGIFIQGADGTWKVNESMITSQAQLNGLVQMMRQDDARQGRWKSEQAARQKKVDQENRDFLKNIAAYDPDDIASLTSEQLASEVGAIKQENVEQGIKEGDEQRVKDYGGTATQQNQAAGRPDSIKEGAEDVPGMLRTDLTDIQESPTGNVTGRDANGNLVYADTGKLVADTAVDLVNEIEPAKPREDTQSPKTGQSPKVDEEGK